MMLMNDYYYLNPMREEYLDGDDENDNYLTLFEQVLMVQWSLMDHLR